MSMIRRGAALAVVLLSTSAGAQQASPDSVGRHWSYGLWGGLARNSPTNIWGAERARDVAFGGVRLTRYHRPGHRVAVDYYIDLVPAAWVSPPREEGPPPCSQLTPADGPITCVIDPPQKTTAVGFGAAPFGTQLRVRILHGLQPYVALNAGMLWFGRPVPSDRAAQFNLTADAGTGVLIGHPGRMGLMLGYRFQHISNGGTAASNPGVDGHMLYAGIMRLPR